MLNVQKDGIWLAASTGQIWVHWNFACVCGTVEGAEGAKGGHGLDFFGIVHDACLESVLSRFHNPLWVWGQEEPIVSKSLQEHDIHSLRTKVGAVSK